MKIRIEPYKSFSGGARALADHCGILRATRKQVNKHGNFDVIINWGKSERRFEGEYLNSPEAVTVASNKLLAARAFSEAEVPQPGWTTDREEAQGWLEDGPVVERRLLRASAGRGIRVTSRVELGAQADEAGAEVPRIGQAPLYTRYMKKADEYRVHVFRGRVLDIQQKRKRQEVDNDDVDYQIRNAHNGWVYCREDVDCPPTVTEAAVAAVEALGLDFGAADIGYNRHHDNPFVFEVNTAPGLEGTTLDRYYYAFLEAFPSLNGGAYARRRAA